MKFSKATVLSIALASIFSAKNVQAGLFDSPLKATKIAGVKDVFSGLKFHYLDREDRLMIVNDFLKTVELEYALLPLKAERIGLDFNKLKAEALDAENNTADILLASADRNNSLEKERISFLQAKSNMEFLDRMQLLLQNFKTLILVSKKKL